MGPVGGRCWPWPFTLICHPFDYFALFAYTLYPLFEANTNYNSIFHERYVFLQFHVILVKLAFI